jgi:hypothetical protein
MSNESLVTAADWQLLQAQRHREVSCSLTWAFLVLGGALPDLGQMVQLGHRKQADQLVQLFHSAICTAIGYIAGQTSQSNFRAWFAVWFRRSREAAQSLARRPKQ